MRARDADRAHASAPCRVAERDGRARSRNETGRASEGRTAGERTTPVPHAPASRSGRGDHGVDAGTHSSLTAVATSTSSPNSGLLADTVVFGNFVRGGSRTP